jgi:CheY-like chemotaxis protein
VIALDVVMPGMTGWSVLTALKEDPETRNIPVVMTTMIDDRNLGLALGASEHLTKPIDRAHLTSVIERHLPGRGHDVLVIEDDAATREMVRRVVEQAGHTVREAENGRIGLKRVDEALPALILLDLLMPEMDGFAFLEAARERDDLRGIPVAVITGKDLTEEDHARLNGGVERIVRKGAGKGDFLEEVRALVARSGD